MTKLFDQAAELEQLQRELALAAQRRRSTPLGPSLSHCDDCGADIPPLRRETVPGCTRCVPCQTTAEKRRP